MTAIFSPLTPAVDINSDPSVRLHIANFPDTNRALRPALSRVLGRLRRGEKPITSELSSPPREGRHAARHADLPWQLAEKNPPYNYVGRHAGDGGGLLAVEHIAADIAAGL